MFKTPNTEAFNPWKWAVVVLIAVMCGMYAGTAQTGEQLKALKASLTHQVTTSTIPK